jgi:cytochrome c oxidase subunit II
MAADPAAAPKQPTDSSNEGVRVVVAWIVLSTIATPLVAIYVGPLIPPGNASVQAQGQTFTNQVMVSILTPVLCLMVVFFGYALQRFRARRSEVILDGPPLRNDARIQLLWILITSSIVLFLAGFGTYELLKDGSGGGQGPNPIALPAGHNSAFQVQVIGQQWQFTYRYPSLGGMESNQLVLPADRLIRLNVT